jgi:hypothetical protein
MRFSKIRLHKNLIVSSLFVSLLCAIPAASARNVVFAPISRLQSSEGNVAFVYFDVEPSGVKPACAANNTSKAFVLDITTSGGKVMFQSLLLAKATGTKVTVLGRADYPSTYPPALQTGNNACSVWNLGNGNGVEMINNMLLENQ